jgi:glycosyltransferase involved in cell wall biosynthesis
VSFDVSVIIPTYNRATFICATLESILSQSLPPAEVIVIDDGSTDDTREIVKAFEPRVKYLWIENSGVCRARNIGVEASSSSWIAFCDSDDLWCPDKLAVQARMVMHAPDVAYGFTNFRVEIDGNISKDTKFDTLPPWFWDIPKRAIDDDILVVDEPLFRHILHHQPIFPSTIIMKRSFYYKIGGFNDLFGRTPSEDLEFTLRCVEHPPIGITINPVVIIKKHSGNFSANDMKNKLGEMDILRYQLENNSIARKYESDIREQIVLRSISCVAHAFLVGDLDLIRLLLRSIPFGRRSLKVHFKGLIAYLPKPVGRQIQSILIDIATFIRNTTNKL